MTGLAGRDAVKRTPAVWQDLLGLRVLDPDGWDRSDFDADWARPLTRPEFEAKAMQSTTALDTSSYWHPGFAPNDYLGEVTP